MAGTFLQQSFVTEYVVNHQLLSRLISELSTVDPQGFVSVKPLIIYAFKPTFLLIVIDFLLMNKKD